MSFFTRNEKPFLVAGPCSAESGEQVTDIARALQNTPVHLFRAGVWKPRTRPGSFEGIGEKALSWLKDVKIEFNMPVAVEVATPTHAELALQYGIDVVWLGARTTVNPFLVQRIADTLRGTKIPVMVKNPVNPDVDLWQGAIERIASVGITDIAAIHRGFSTYNAASAYRNQPNWPIPIELKRRMPDLPIICDPSHITGNRDMVAAIAQKAMDMGFEGLMIETHTNPDKALSDSAQQITPGTLYELLAKLVVRDNKSAGLSKEMGLEYLRQVMDGIDAEIIDLIARRMELSSKIGQVKKECNMTAYQPDRWNEIVETRGNRAEQAGLSRQFIVELYEKIHHHSISKQLEILQGLIKELKS